MKKIFAGFLGLVMVVAVVAGTAYAVFSSTAEVNGLAFSTGNAELRVSTSGGSGTWTTAISYEGVALPTDMYPGYSGAMRTFYVQNNSNSDISLSLKARLVSATEDWGSLANVAEIRMQNSDGGDSDWYTLADWNATDGQDMDLTLGQGDDESVTVEVRIPVGAGNEISGKTVNTNWVLTGTQVTGDGGDGEE